MYEHFLVEKADRLATITLNRPEKRNPINENMLLEFDAILRDLRDDVSTRVVILTGTGNSFCAGADLGVLKDVTDLAERRRLFAEARNRRSRLIGRTFSLLENLEQPSIAAINGFAIGGGWGLALACDFRLAVPGAQFWFPEVDLGVPLNVGSTARLFSTVGASRAKEIILLCDRYKAEDLLTWGMLHRLVPPDKLMATAHELATRLLAKPPKAVTGSKLTVNTIAAVAAREMSSVHPEFFIHSQEA